MWLLRFRRALYPGEVSDLFQVVIELFQVKQFSETLMSSCTIPPLWPGVVLQCRIYGSSLNIGFTYEL